MDAASAESRSELRRLHEELRGELRQLLEQQTKVIVDAVAAEFWGRTAPLHETLQPSGEAVDDVCPSLELSVPQAVQPSEPDADTQEHERGSSREEPGGDAGEVPGKGRVAQVTSQGRRGSTNIHDGVIQGAAMVSEPSGLSWETLRWKSRADSQGLAGRRAKWEWQRSSGDWAQYPERESNRIERDLWRGKTMCSVKSGREGKTPVEIFYADMMQVDPLSGNARQIRRNGERQLNFTSDPWLHVRRSVNAFRRELWTGLPAFESFSECQLRAGLRYESKLDLSGVSVHEPVAYSRCHSAVDGIPDQPWFHATSIVATFLQMIWVFAVLNKMGEERQQGIPPALFYDRGAFYLFVEHFFCLFFLLELCTRYVALKRTSTGLRDAWFVFDVVCVCLSIVDVVVIPLLQLRGGSAKDILNTGGVRVFRLGRILRVLRVFSQFSELQTVVKGALYGMQAAAYVWLLVGCLIISFGLVMFSLVEDTDVTEMYFATIEDSFLTMLYIGVMLDDIYEFGTTVFKSGEIIAGFAFLFFQILTFFGLLNMLIGSFCNSAIQVSQIAQQERDFRRLKRDLRDILECYLDRDQDTIDKVNFNLVMKDQAFRRLLHQTGTDVESLMTIREIVFSRDDAELSLHEFNKMIMNLRADAPAVASHVVSLSSLIKEYLHRLEKHMDLARSMSAVASEPVIKSGTDNKQLPRG